jgi:hypothetical protein
MSQIVNGVYRGAPGPVGSPPCIDFCETTVPSDSADPQVASCANGSTYSNVNGGTSSTYYVKVNGAWVNLA